MIKKSIRLEVPIGATAMELRNELGDMPEEYRFASAELQQDDQIVIMTFEEAGVVV